MVCSYKTQIAPGRELDGLAGEIKPEFLSKPVLMQQIQPIISLLDFFCRPTGWQKQVGQLSQGH